MSLKAIWKNALAAVVAVAVIIPAAQAADLGGRPKSYKDDADYGPPRYLWTGLYTGLQAGYGWNSSSMSDASINPALRLDSDGFIGGATLGYNFQAGQIVWGIETDISYANLDSGLTGVGYFGASTASIDWLWTLRGRVGIDINGWMPYVTGGLAMADAEMTVNAGGNGKSETLTGWTVGGGLEVKLDRNWSFKTEYLYVDLGDISTSRPPLAAPPLRTSFDELHIVRAGINYKF
jgi:outer membrane immunogenic protein